MSQFQQFPSPHRADPNHLYGRKIVPHAPFEKINCAVGTPLGKNYASSL